MDNLPHVIEQARLIATAAHYGQFRRDGVTPYITHPEAVAAMVEGRLKPIAWLHDVVEDTWINSGTLDASPLPAWIVTTVLCLTKHEYESYQIYIGRLIRFGGHDAIVVKLADIRHNLSCQPSQHSIEKSKWSIPVLEQALCQVQPSPVM